MSPLFAVAVAFPPNNANSLSSPFASVSEKVTLICNLLVTVEVSALLASRNLMFEDVLPF